MNTFRLQLQLALLAVLVILVNAGTFVVGEREKAIKLALGEIQSADYSPGLYFKMPFYHDVKKFDARLITLDARPNRVLTSEKKNLEVNTFLNWRIADPEQYFRSTSGSERRTQELLSQFLEKGLLDEFGKRTIQEAISTERVELMQRIKDSVAEQAFKLGVEIIDVRVKKADLPLDVSSSVYLRMEKERERVAKDFRARGEERSKGIRAEAERQREEILAEAYRKAQIIRGDGDAAAAATYAHAHGQDPDFYRFFRSLEAYQDIFQKNQDTIILGSDSDFFRYFRQSE